MKKLFLLIFPAVVATATVSAAEPVSYKSGNNEIIQLPEGHGPGQSDILIDAPDRVLEKYAPDGTFPIATNAFLIKRNGRNILVDTGYGHLIFDNLAAAGVSPEDIDQIILTHMHNDHTGGLLRNGEKAFPDAKLSIGRIEYDYWNSDEQMNRLPEDRRSHFLQARAVIEKYGDNLELLEAREIGEIAPDECGIHPVAAYGHTPGHIGIMAVCCGNRFLIWGDLTHAMAVQMPHPEIAVTYDIDPARAIESRLEILKYVSENEIPVAGMHIPYPSMGIVTVNPDGGYIFTPAE